MSQTLERGQSNSRSRRAEPISVLTATTLFPNPAQQVHGIFVETRLRKLLATGEIRAHVLAPVPWLPPLVKYGAYGPIRNVPSREVRDEFIIEHPRYAVLPKVGMNVTPLTLYWAMLKRTRRLIAQGHHFDLIDAHYFYPDGVAASWLAKALDLPLVITARGTDINVLPSYRVPKMLIQQAAARADAIITVSRALKGKLETLGIASDRITMLRNGVDLELFQPTDRKQARSKLDLTGRTIGCVGNLVELKGHRYVIGALPSLPAVCLVLVGDGPERRPLEALADKLGVADRVRFLGRLPQSRLPEIYSAIDALALPSSREGWPNVLLEAMACGTPVIASSVSGIPEIVASPEAGVLMQTLSAEGFARAAHTLFANPPDRNSTRRYAERFDWSPTSEGQLSLFRRILG